MTKPNEWEEFECSGPYCNHERSDKHYIVGEDVLSQAILSAEERGREEGIRECIEALPKKIQVKLEEPVLRQYDPTPNACGGYSSVPFYCSLCGMGEMDIQDNKIDGAYHCACSIWTNSCGGKWVQWLDKEKAQKMAEELPSEDNFFNQAIDQATKALLSLPDQKELLKVKK